AIVSHGGDLPSVVGLSFATQSYQLGGSPPLFKSAKDNLRYLSGNLYDKDSVLRNSGRGLLINATRRIHYNVFL
ncbi:hypothetical protein, partial [Seongchinamella unica]|uniref:hypothetical protein n=1 Tax=Seongchinamella unica TaxID=2547392 RepID=UPI001EEF051A